MIQRTERVWVSDNNDPHDRQTINRWTSQLLPLELMGTHIASGRSHVTDRTHLLSFRAVTAFFGHIGVEWNLLQESAEDKAELAEWIALHKQEREMLHTGRLVRGDPPDASLFVTGVVSTDGARAVYGVALLERKATASPGRVRLPGLDAGSTYRLEPVLIGGIPRGADPAH